MRRVVTLWVVLATLIIQSTATWAMSAHNPGAVVLEQASLTLSHDAVPLTHDHVHTGAGHLSMHPGEHEEHGSLTCQTACALISLPAQLASFQVTAFKGVSILWVPVQYRDPALRSTRKPPRAV